MSNFFSLEYSHLRCLIGAISFQFDIALKYKSKDPEKLRTEFWTRFGQKGSYKRIENISNIHTEKINIIMQNSNSQIFIFDPDKENISWLTCNSCGNSTIFLYGIFLENKRLKIFEMSTSTVIHITDQHNPTYGTYDTFTEPKNIDMIDILTNYGSVVSELGEFFGYDIVINSTNS
jgi:hypothetical protein